jgi:hypothetical protein
VFFTFNVDTDTSDSAAIRDVDYTISAEGRAVIAAGQRTGQFQVFTLRDNQVDGNNFLRVSLATVNSRAKVEISDGTDSLHDAFIIDTDETAFSFQLPASGEYSVTEGETLGLSVSLTKSVRKALTVTLYTSVADDVLIPRLDFPELEEPFIIPAGVLRVPVPIDIPQNGQVAPAGYFNVGIRDAIGPDSSVKVRRDDTTKLTLEMDAAASQLQNQLGGSGWSVAFRLANDVRQADDLRIQHALDGVVFPVDQDVVFKSENGIVKAGRRVVFYKPTKDATVSVASVYPTQFSPFATGFPVQLRIVEQLSSAVFIPELCALPLRAVGSSIVMVSLVPGEEDVIVPGSCFYYPVGAMRWDAQFRAQKAGKERICDDSRSLCVDITVVVEAQRPVIDLRQQTAPRILLYGDQTSMNVVVADNLLLFQCDQNGGQCCNTIGGQLEVSACSVDQTQFQSQDGLDVSGTVAVSLKATSYGIARQCFGTASDDNTYPDGFCMSLYTPDKPMISNIPEAVVTQSGTMTAKLEIRSGTWRDRRNKYKVSVVCVAGCSAATGKAVLDSSVEGGAWSIEVVGNDISYGDTEFAVVVSDKYYSTSSSWRVRVIQPSFCTKL